ncbi:MAG: hypothetical protein NPIRA03_15900 [Nitrospirales bacterium]|nr:MAG: hypothetical protein NPIRA03_15900 [Nitrospirales bacterium]
MCVWIWVGVVLSLSILGCQMREVQPTFKDECGILRSNVDWSNRIKVLNLLSQAFSRKCDGAVIEYTKQAQSGFRDKTFSFSGEMAGVFLSDGVLTDYVLESYERAYLSVLLAASYLRTGQVEDAKVELRQLDHELFAPLYNFGEDPVNLVLSAVLWEVLGEPGDARIDWFRLAEPTSSFLLHVPPALQSFAQQQVIRLDQSARPTPRWEVYGIGRFPEVDWDFKLFGAPNGYFVIHPKPPFQKLCVSETGLRLSTESWFAKIAHRHDHAYHPLLNIQSWIRLPFGVVYGLVPFSLGVGVAVSGCAGAASLGGRDSGDLCALSILGGVQLMQIAPTVFQNTVRPDLRHWELLPAAIVVTQESDVGSEPCDSRQARLHLLVTRAPAPSFSP